MGTTGKESPNEHSSAADPDHNHDEQPCRRPSDAQAVADSGPAIPECAECGKTEGDVAPAKLLRCLRCKLVLYCGPQCQQRGWKAHKRECVRVAPGTAAQDVQSGASVSKTQQPVPEAQRLMAWYHGLGVPRNLEEFLARLYALRQKLGELEGVPDPDAVTRFCLAFYALHLLEMFQFFRFKKIYARHNYEGIMDPSTPILHLTPDKDLCSELSKENEKCDALAHAFLDDGPALVHDVFPSPYYLQIRTLIALGHTNASPEYLTAARGLIFGSSSAENLVDRKMRDAHFVRLRRAEEAISTVLMRWDSCEYIEDCRSFNFTSLADIVQRFEYLWDGASELRRDSDSETALLLVDVVCQTLLKTETAFGEEMGWKEGWKVRGGNLQHPSETFQSGVESLGGMLEVSRLGRWFGPNAPPEGAFRRASRG